MRFSLLFYKSMLKYSDLQRGQRWMPWKEERSSNLDKQVERNKWEHRKSLSLFLSWSLLFFLLSQISNIIKQRQIGHGFDWPSSSILPRAIEIILSQFSIFSLLFWLSDLCLVVDWVNWSLLWLPILYWSVSHHHILLTTFHLIFSLFHHFINLLFNLNLSKKSWNVRIEKLLLLGTLVIDN